MKCYTGSTQFSDMLRDTRENSITPASIAKRAATAKRGEGKPCLECGVDVYIKKSQMSKKYCSTVCYRSYMAKRFDRHIANPETVNLQQGYDAFLDKNLLACPIDGCDWQGHFLALHVNLTHGFTAAEFKRAAGFNKGTGIVSKPTAIALKNRASQGVALSPEFWAELGEVFPQWVRIGLTNEGREHHAKARALMGQGPARVCIGCGNTFAQSTPIGKAKYCAPSCRSLHYSVVRKEKKRVQGKSVQDQLKGKKI